MECRVVGGLDALRTWAWDTVVLGQVKPSKFHCGISDLLGLWAFTSLFSFWALVHCSCVDGATATSAYEVPSAGSACQEGTDASSSSWRGEAGAGAWAGPGLGIGENGHGGLLAVMERGALAWALNNITERPAFKSANPTPPITMQTPRRDAAKGISDIVTLCLFPMQGGKSASTEGTLRGGGAAGGGDTRAGGGGTATRRGGGAASERQREGLRLGGGRLWVLWGRGRRDQCAGEQGVPRGNKARGCFSWRHCNGAGVGGTRQEHRDQVKRRGN